MSYASYLALAATDPCSAMHMGAAFPIINLDSTFSRECRARALNPAFAGASLFRSASSRLVADIAQSPSGSTETYQAHGLMKFYSS